MAHGGGDFSVEHLHALILAGGGGTRLWPLSRRSKPKQFLRLADDDTLIGACASRVQPLCGWQQTWIVTSQQQEAAARAALPYVPADNFIVEPCGRNTAPAIGLAAQCIHARDPAAVLAVLPADHWIGDAEAFRQLVVRAALAADMPERPGAAGRIVTCGIRPTEPATGYGYIEVGEESAPGLSRAVRFVEKPDADRAKQFVAGGVHLWNSGMFFFRADRILAEIAQHLPELARILRDSQGNPDEATWQTAPSISIDYGIMEKLDEFHVVAADLPWSDVGSFASLPTSQGDVVELAGASRNLVFAQDGTRTVVLAGVQDLCVVVTPDAVLVCPKDRAQDVKKIVTELARRGREELL